MDNWQDSVSSKYVGSLKNLSIPIDVNANQQMKNSWYGLSWMWILDSLLAFLLIYLFPGWPWSSGDSVASEGGADSSDKTNTFKSVRELSQSAEKLKRSSYVDMVFFSYSYRLWREKEFVDVWM